MLASVSVRVYVCACVSLRGGVFVCVCVLWVGKLRKDEC